MSDNVMHSKANRAVILKGIFYWLDCYERMPDGTTELRCQSAIAISVRVSLLTGITVTSKQIKRIMIKLMRMGLIVSRCENGRIKYKVDLRNWEHFSDEYPKW